MSNNLAESLVPDIMVPSQLLRRPRWTPEQRLYHAILQDALEQLQINNHIYRKNFSAYNLYKAAWDWIHNPDTAHIASFQNICEILNLDSASVLATIDAQYAEPTIRPEIYRSPKVGNIWERLGIQVTTEEASGYRYSRRLLLERRLGVYLTSAPSGLKPHQKVYAGMRSWIWSEKDTRGSFLDVCRVVEIDPCELRTALERQLGQEDR